MIGIAVGSGLSDEILREFTPTVVEVDGRKVELYFGHLAGVRVCLLPRHGVRVPVGPHLIDHAANLKAMAEYEVTTVVGISSTGSLRREYRVPSIMIPEDYIDLHGSTVHTGPVHIVPELSGRVREALIKAARELKVRPLYTRGVYFQTRGPRLETKAEIAMISQFADVVGMTMGSEATVAMELGMEYASICTVDNYAHGVGKGLSPEAIKDAARTNTATAIRIVEKAIPEL